jgi:hypothetical protein
MKFKIGDRVRVVNYRDYPQACDKPCVITGIGPAGPMQYTVRFDELKLGTGSFGEDDLELVAR